MNSVKIGRQQWATDDLRVTHFRNGEDIPLVKYNTEWVKFETAAYCITPKGHYLYNWFAVNDPRGLAPEEFHVPSDEEWTELVEHLGGAGIAGEKIKVSSWDGTNSSGFSALPGGYRSCYIGNFLGLGNNGGWWSSSPIECGAWCRYLKTGNPIVFRFYYELSGGFSVRCIKAK